MSGQMMPSVYGHSDSGDDDRGMAPRHNGNLACIQKVNVVMGMTAMGPNGQSMAAPPGQPNNHHIMAQHSVDKWMFDSFAPWIPPGTSGQASYDAFMQTQPPGLAYPYSECGNYADADSGYGTNSHHMSIAPESVHDGFVGHIQSHVSDLGEPLQHDQGTHGNSLVAGDWPAQEQSIRDSMPAQQSTKSTLWCKGCNQPVKNQSELK
jgi:hypothetical protein